MISGKGVSNEKKYLRANTQITFPVLNHKVWILHVSVKLSSSDECKK